MRDSHSGFVHECKLRFKILPNFSGTVTGVHDVPFGVAETFDPYARHLLDSTLGRAQRDGALQSGRHGLVREQDGGFSLVLAFAMYYVWRTVMLQGTYTYDFALWPFAGQWQEADLHRRALEYNFPLVAAGSAPGSGRLGSLAQPLEADSPGAVVTALYPRDGAPHLRVFEYRAHRRACSSAGRAIGSRRWSWPANRGLDHSTLALAPWRSAPCEWLVWSLI